MAKVEASGLVLALEQVWTAVRRHHSEVPAVVVTLGAGSVGVPRGVLKLGHFAADRWTSAGADSSAVAELFVGGEGLARGPESVLATLLHEAAHGLADARRIQDTSRQGRYHNTRYKALAEELGLHVTQLTDIGWSGTVLADNTAARYAEELAQLACAITAYRYAEGTLTSPGAGKGGGKAGSGGGGAAGGSSPKNGLVLACECPRRIRASTTVVSAGPILCGVCNSEFK
ncbi:MAG TPA: hypothetical protein VFP89_15130 [Propionibacteriaceae bacterium]|nr:hypothetical protein [Propionibacteriaceae bacterium]